MDVYNIFFNVCLGLFIGGLILSIISMILAGTAIEHQGMSHLDHVDHLDHIDHIDHLDHVDHLDHIDQVDHVVHIDHIDQLDHPVQIDHVDHIDQTSHINHLEHTEHLDKDHLQKIEHSKDSGSSDNIKDITPAPFMLLFSEFLLVFGISGILLNFFIVDEWLKWINFLITPLTSFLFVKLVSILWKRIAINRHYNIIYSSRNIIGKVGEVILDVDNKGGVVKIKSDTPMEFEKIHSKPWIPEKQFSKGQQVYIYGKKDGYFLVDDEIPSQEEVQICPNCGAFIGGESGFFCEYCGAELSQKK
ncbi:MAG: NfeD family protein [Candidatus Helarchaeota archaeon]